MFDDKYKEVKSPTTGIYKEKGSKFIAYAFPVYSEEEVKKKLEELKKLEHAARHHCYAYILHSDKSAQRANDDGEPSNSAGMPIYGQIQSFQVTNILVVSVRYFGGTKLGVGGLINAYRSSARLALESSIIKEKTVDIFYKLNFQYDLMSKVMRTLKENSIIIQHQKFEIDCEMIIAVRKSNAKKVFEIFKAFYKVEIRALDS